jgi:hypothetical protein
LPYLVVARLTKRLKRRAAVTRLTPQAARKNEVTSVKKEPRYKDKPQCKPGAK